MRGLRVRRFASFGLMMVMAASALSSHASPGSGRSVSPSLADGASHDEHAAFDVRFTHPVEALGSARRAATDLTRRVPGTQITWNDRFGTAKIVEAPPAGYLTAGTGRRLEDAAAAQVARAFVAQNSALFGLGADAVAALRVTRNVGMPGGGVRVVTVRVMYGSLPTYSGGSISVSMTPDGRVIFAGADTGLSGALASTTPRLSATDALLRVAAFLKMPTFRPAIHQASQGVDRLTIFTDKPSFAMRPNARLVAFPTASGPVLSWRVFFPKEMSHIFATAVDARNGDVLFSHDQVASAEGKIYKNYPGAPKGGTQEVVSFDGDKAASPLTWNGLPVSTTQSIDLHTTIGNNVFAWNDFTRMKLAPAGLALTGAQVNPIPDYAPVSPDNKFNYDFQNNWGSNCTPVSTSAVPGAPKVSKENPSYLQDRDPSVTNAFYLANKIHDLAFAYGFNEKNGNFQWQNFTADGKAKDPIRVSAMAGIVNGSLDNANMWTPPDGGEPADLINPTNPTSATKVKDSFPPHANMYLFRPVRGFNAPCVDGDQDASILWHEYTHGITNRMVGGPDDVDALSAAQSGSMGEAWSDWVALSFLFQQGLESRAVTGIYATGNKTTGIRNYALDKNPLTYGDFGYGTRGPEVHDDGEIWAGTLWEMRTTLTKAFGTGKGADIANHLVFDALAISPRLPTMIDMRSAIVAADKARYRSAHAALLWSVFARRGMGVSAKAKNAADTHPIPGYDVPGAGNGLLRGVVSDADGGTLANVRVLIGGLQEGQPNATARTSTTGEFAVKLQPGSYKVTVGAAGYGYQPFGIIRVAKAATVTKAFLLLKNLASVGYGATVVSGLAAGDHGLALIDDGDASGQQVTVGKPVVIRLGGTAPATIRSISVTQRPSSNSDLRAATAYTVDTSLDGKKWTRAVTGGVKIAEPFLRTTEYLRRHQRVAAVKARFVRYTAIKTFGDTPDAALAGIQVFGSAPGVAVAPVGGGAPFSEDGTVAVANAGGDTASVTLGAWQATCAPPPSGVQGFDTYMVELPDGSGDGAHYFTLTNHGGQSTDLDTYFYAADCSTVLGRAATGSADEAGPLPPGSKWVQVVLFAGTTDGFTATSASTLERVVPPKGTPTRRPATTGGGGAAAGAVAIHYLAAGGDTGYFNCDGSLGGIPAIGGVCYTVKAGQKIHVAFADDVAAKVGGSYAFQAEGDAPVVTSATAFCGDFNAVVPAGVGIMSVFIESTGTAACSGEPPSTGTATATFK